MWLLTVPSLTKSRSAISVLERPSAMRDSTTSRDVSPTGRHRRRPRRVGRRQRHQLGAARHLRRRLREHDRAMSAVEVVGLTKRFGDLAAVDCVSVEVPDGQLLAVLGPNGAGKTTTLEILEGFMTPTSGTVRVLGADPHRGDRSWRAHVGLVMQSTGLDAELTVRDTLGLFAQLYPRPMRIREVLELVELTDDAQTRGAHRHRHHPPRAAHQRRPPRHPLPAPRRGARGRPAPHTWLPPRRRRSNPHHQQQRRHRGAAGTGRLG
jgi:ABC-type glutathione transport system ATPase component